MPRRLSSQVFSFVTAFGLCAGAFAAELGEPRVGSHIGQQLVADIELTALDDPAAAVQVRLANADVYRGAGIDMPAVLSSLNMNVMGRDGKQFLHITSLKPVDSEHLHLFLELNDGGRRTVRLATLWFTADPTPPAPRPAPVAAAPADEPLAPAPRPVQVAANEPVPPPLAWKSSQPRPAPKHLAKAPELQACKPHPAAQPQPDPVCAALDEKNADLRAKLARLEEKVKSLQNDAGRKLSASSEKVAAPAEKLRPQVPSVKQNKLAQPQAQPSRLAWGWIAAAGSAVFVLVGALQFLRMRRAKAIANRKAKASRPAKQDAEAPVEPTLG